MFRKIIKKIVICPLNYLYEKKMMKINKGKLKNNSVSLIANTCIAGVIYKRLGIPFLSPTINTWISQKDFVKLAQYPQAYLCGNIEENGRRESDNCPIGRINGPLGNIFIYFVHYDSFDYAVKKWYERAKRIDWNNLYFITTDGNGVTNEELMTFSEVKCKNKVILTKDRGLSVPSCYYLDNLGNDLNASGVMLHKHKLVTAHFNFEDTFDYIRFINCDI